MIWLFNYAIRQPRWVELYLSFSTFAQLIITFGTAVTYIIHPAATEWYKTRTACSIATTPAHGYRCAYLRACHFVVRSCHALLAAVRVRTGELHWVALPNQPRHPFKLSHFLLADVIRVFHHLLVGVLLHHGAEACGWHRSHTRSFNDSLLRHINDATTSLWDLGRIWYWWQFASEWQTIVIRGRPAQRLQLVAPVLLI